MLTAVDRECGAAPDVGKVVEVINRHHLNLADQPG
jgi:hypothetical protein